MVVMEELLVRKATVLTEEVGVRDTMLVMKVMCILLLPMVEMAERVVIVMGE